VVTIDVGDRDNLHPPDKQTVGHRLALAARTTVYHEQLEFSGPLYAGKSLERNALRVHFHHADGLHCRENHVPGFEIAGSDGVFLPAAQANIEGPCIVVSHPEIPLPSDARYGWDDDPKLDLYNSAGLPASPFSTEM
jgi:sialate O-acetylesterase